MKSILDICFTDLSCDPRVYRQLLFLSDGGKYDIAAAGFDHPGIKDINYLGLQYKPKTYLQKATEAFKLKCKLYENCYWTDQKVTGAYDKLKNAKYDLIISNDLNTLPLAVKLSRRFGSKVLFDSHEYAPGEFDERFVFNYFLKDYYIYLCQRYIKHSDVLITVCEGIAEKYSKKFGGKWHVVTNAPFFEPYTPKPIRNDGIRIIHHGGLNRSRNIENMIDLFDMLDERFQLDFMFVNSNPKYLNELKKRSGDNPRIRFRNPVKMNEIVRTINNYDIGLYLLPANNFNNQMALPNKFFEFIQARLAIAIWPSPEMARITNKFNCGVVSNEFSIESIANALNKLRDEDIMHFKTNSDKAASYLCAEKNSEILSGLVSKLLN